MTEAGSELVVQLADGVAEEHALLEVLTSRVDASPKGDVADIVEGFLDLVEEGLVVTEEAALEGGVLRIAEFYLHRARTEETVECGLLGPVSSVKQGVPAGIDLIPEVSSVLQTSVVRSESLLHKDRSRLVR